MQKNWLSLNQKENGTADIGDVGISFGPLAESKELTLPYKTNYWEEFRIGQRMMMGIGC